MGLSVTSRPEKTINVPNNPYYNEGMFQSQWNSAWLPIQYILSSTLFPTNNVDSTQAITGVSTNGGFAALAITTHGYNVGDYLTVTGTTSYNGIHQVQSVPNANSVVIPLAYVADETGTSLKYYNNYEAKIKVYAGLPVTHPLSVLRPVTVVATLSFEPDSDNEVRFDIAPFVRDVLTSETFKTTDVGFPNDLNGWNSFYISYAESYDQGTSTDSLLIERFTTGFTIDVDAAYLERIFYAIYGAKQYGDQYGGNFGEYAVSAGNGLKAKFLTEFSEDSWIRWKNGLAQDFSIILDKETTMLKPPVYLFYKNIEPGGGQDDSFTFVQQKVYGEGLYRIPVKDVFYKETSKFLRFFLVAPDDDITSVGAYSQVGGGTSWTVSGSPFPISVVASGGTKIIRIAQPDILTGMRYYFAIDVDASASANNIIVSLTAWNGTQQQVFGSTQVDAGYVGEVYLFFSSETTRQNITDFQIQATPQSGTFSITINGYEIYPMPEVTNNTIIPYDCFDEFSEFPGGPTDKSFLDWDFIASLGTIIQTPTQISCTMGSGEDFTIGTNGQYLMGSSNIGKAFDSTMTIEVVSGTVDIYMGLQNVFQDVGFGVTAGTYNYSLTGQIATVDDAPIIYVQEAAGSSAEVTITSFFMKCQDEPLSTCLASCGRYSYYIKWLNKLGGWEYWEFYTDENVSFDVDNVKTVKLDKWDNWDTGFIANERQYKRTGIEVRKKQQVRSQYLNLEQIQGMESLKYTPQAYLITADGETPVQIEAGSFELYNTTDKIYQIEFNILFNNTIVQQ